MLVDEAVLGRRGEEVLLIVEAVVVLESGDVGEEFKTIGRGRGDRGTGDNVFWRGGVFGVIAKGKSGPDGGFGWGGGEGLGDSGDEDRGVEMEVFLDWGRGARGYKDGRGRAICISARGREVPSVEVTVKYLKDSGGGISKVLLVDIVNGRPGGDGNLREGRGSDGGGLRGSERHF